MSFWKSVGDFALDVGKSMVKEASHGVIDFDKGVSRSVKESTSNYKEYKKEMEELDDSDLLQLVRNDWDSSNHSRKWRAAAAHAELKSRGYTAEEIKG